MEPAVIRKLTGADAAAFQSLRLQSLRECPSVFASSVEEERELTLSSIAERLEPRSDRAVFGAFLEPRLVGFVGLMRESHRKLAHKAYIWGMYVASESRRGGIGRQLITAALSVAQSELSVRQVNLGVNARNEAALALYTEMGFTEFGRESCFMLVDGVAHDEVHMVHVLQRRRGDAAT
jgi:ribosomal protein S18 acetylase RimI-like enzyme